MATGTARPHPYCPYDVVPIDQVLAGTELMVDSAFGPLRCFRTDPSPGGTVTVFLHGVHDDTDTWSPLVRAATEGGIDLGPLLFVDLPGFGRSARGEAPLALPAVGDAVLQAVEQVCGAAPVRLVGHSMGTLVAVDLAVRHPDRVHSVHLAAGPYYSLVDTINGRLRLAGPSGVLAGGLFVSQYALALTGQAGVGWLRWLDRVGLLRGLLAPFVAHPYALRPSVVAHLLSGLRPRPFRDAAANGFRYRDGMSWAAVRCPIHAVFGSADRLVPRRDARRLRLDCPDAVITVLPDAAHFLHLEQPAAALAHLGLTHPPPPLR